MPLSDLASIGSLVSGLAVLISLIYLGLQARQNAASFLRAENNATQSQNSAFRLAIVENRDVARLWLEGQKIGSTLDQVDELRFETLLSEVFWIFYQEDDRAQRGVWGEWQRSTLSDLAKILISERGARWWNKSRHVTDPKFAGSVDLAIREFQTRNAESR